MIKAGIPQNEAERLKALYSYNILDSLPEKSYDDITRIAALICNVPIAHITFIDKDRQWFKSNTSTPVRETSREDAFCAHTIISPTPLLEVEEAEKDERFSDNPFVTGEPHISFYAGAPLTTDEGFNLGTLCVADHQPRKLDDHQRKALIALSRQVMALLELHKRNQELEHLNKKLQQSELNHKLLAENSHDMIALHNEDGTYRHVSSSVKNILGYEPEELLGKNPEEFLHPADKQYVLFNVFSRLRKGHVLSEVEFRLRHKNGGYVWLEANAQPVYDELGQFSAFQTSKRNISKRKVAQANLRALTENTDDAIWAIDPSFHYLSFNSVFVNLGNFFSSEKPLVGQAVQVPEKMGILKDLYGRVLGGEKFSYEIAVSENMANQTDMPASQDDLTFYELHFNPIRDASEQLYGATIHAKNITESKKTHQMLQLAKEQAEEASKAKEQFLSTMSHEIRTPMNAILGTTHLLIQENPRPEQMDHLKLLRFSGENLLGLINDILDFNKIEAGKIELEQIDFNLKELLLNIKNSLAPKAKEKGIDLLLSYEEDLPQIFVGDSLRLSQVLNNLVSNALKFTSSGFILIDVSCRQQEGNEYVLNFRVKDTGIGVSIEYQGLIFESFAQASRDVSRKYGGTGLGLAITKSLLQLMGAEIAIDSEVGKGSTFYFDLRLRKGDELLQLNQSSHFQPPIREQHLLPKNIHILVAEDNKANQLIIRRFLEKWGIKVTFAENGYEVLEKLKEKSYHLILMDLQMPELDGYQTSRIIRETDDEYYRQIPIVALTASALLDVQYKVKKMGMDDFVTKPFNPEVLYAKIAFYAEKIKPGEHSESEKVRQVINYYADGNQEFVREFACRIIDNYTEFLEVFSIALTKNDGKKQRSAAHKIKSINDLFSYKELNAAIEEAQQLKEATAKTDALQKIQEYCNSMKNNLEPIAGIEDKQVLSHA